MTYELVSRLVALCSNGMEECIYVFSCPRTHLVTNRDTVLSRKVLPILRRDIVSTVVVHFRASQTEHSLTRCVLFQFLDPLFCGSKRLLVGAVVHDQGSFCVTQIHPVEHHKLLISWHIVQLKNTYRIVSLKCLLLDSHHHVLCLFKLFAERFLRVPSDQTCFAGA